MSMFTYTMKRLLLMIPVVLAVLTLTFFLARLGPRDPVLAFLPPQFSQAQYDSVEQSLGLHLPLWQQYFLYIKDLFAGNWGISSGVDRGQPVWGIIWTRFPRTFDITVSSIFLSSIIGIVAGIISSTNRNKWKDTTVRFIALVGVSIPVFWMGLLIRFFFAGGIPGFSILPGTGFKTSGLDNPTVVTNFIWLDSILEGRFDLLWDYILHLIMPVFCLTFITIASVTRQTRSSMLEVLEQDYIRTSRAKGCKEPVVINSHALRNALIPTVTIIGLNFAFLISGAVLTETTFQLVGMGQTIISAIRTGDYWVLQASVFVVTLLFVVINLFTDLIYAFLDPRIRY
ncbi:MAG: ABC transporter permease [Promethearchaeota archaeon]